MRLNISLPSISVPSFSVPSLLGAAFLATLTACGSGDADPFALIQQKDYAGAIAAIEPMLKTVEQGSEDHRNLLVGYTEALSIDSPGKARDAFIAAIHSNKDLLQPDDVTYIVSRMAKQNHLIEAIDVMNEGKKTWPGNAKIDTVLAELITAAAAPENSAAQDKLKGLGYL